MYTYIYKYVYDMYVLCIYKYDKFIDTICLCIYIYIYVYIYIYTYIYLNMYTCKYKLMNSSEGLAGEMEHDREYNVLGRMTLVDLAGSERLKTTQSTGKVGKYMCLYMSLY
jgi:hypothetical protein